MPDVLGGLLARRAAAGPSLTETALLAPARAMMAQPPATPPSLGLLGRIHEAIDPVRALGSYGELLGMALPPGRAPKGGLLVKPELGNFRTTTAGRIINKTRAEGGYTVNLATGEVPKEGLMVGKYREGDPRSQRIEGGLLKPADVDAFVKKNKDALSQPGNFMGTWVEKDAHGKPIAVYLDVSKKFEPTQLRPAVKSGERTAQKAGFNIGHNSGFKIGNWDEFIQSPEFHSRLDQMGAEGADYLSQFPTKNWWDMHGTAFERVYGKENLPQVAGFTAATAPGRKPRPNLQMMSEYMRRYISGEQTIQPNWRAPANVMGGATGPGKKMPFERTRIGGPNPNLSRAAMGEPLSGDKISSEARAMMGDPTVGVYDRYWSDIAENPSANVFTGTRKGVIPRGQGPNRPYMRLHRQVIAAAERNGMSVRDFSANVWTGLRNRIQNVGEAFGVNYRTKGLLGESKSYADHFTDLIAQKAKHLGISVGEMEARLRAGDASLLSLMLSVPFLKHFFSGVQPSTERDKAA